MRLRYYLIAWSVLIGLAASGWTFFQRVETGQNMNKAAAEFLASLSPTQLEKAAIEYQDPQRVDWHFIPKKFRKGLQVRDMNSQQRGLAHQLLQAALSKSGYDKSVKIMKLEQMLHVLEERQQSRRFARDPMRYYFTIFGDPGGGRRWGLSIEGHHLSLNFVIEKDNVISSTPQCLAANPATVKGDYGTDLPRGTRVLAKEEQLAFDLLQALNDRQRESAVLADKAPREVRAAGKPQPEVDEAAGVAVADLDPDQAAVLRELVEEYANALPADVAGARMYAIDQAGFDKVHFAWAGADQPGIGHYYRIQGPTFLVEFVNTQPDAAGNLANHIHCVWRDPHGDFAIAIQP